jgi:SNF2 family DNA or RNA helicase
VIRISEAGGQIVIDAKGADLAPRHESQLAYWGFVRDEASGHLLGTSQDSQGLIAKVVAYFKQHGVEHSVDDHIARLLEARRDAESEMEAARQEGKRFKDGIVNFASYKEFAHFLRTGLKRRLKAHQCKAALHLLCTQNGANFSVPGSGKTTVVLAVFEWLRQRGELDALFVVGPPACFGPWRMEFEAVLGSLPNYEILAGGDVDTRRSKYLVNKSGVCDMYLTSFQTLQRDWEQVKVLFARQGVRFFFVVDEAHYIKQLDGAWANAVLAVAQHASRRCVLTGTPFPRSLSDAFNLFDVLWPQGCAIPSAQRHRIEWHVERHEFERAAEVLDAQIGSLFYRVRKSDLGLARQVIHPPVQVRMNPYERRIYDSVLGRIRDLSELDSRQTTDLVVRLRRGRMIRLRQCLSYASLLGSAVSEYDEDVVPADFSLSDIIRRYATIEQPAKLGALLALVRTLRDCGEKVVIWSNFIRTLELLRDSLSDRGYGVGLIYGGTPVHEADVSEELSREEIIREFCNPTSGMNLLVANPAACAESISLHKTCSHAIYYDLSYNCAQYLQSLDRIHRVGGSENKESQYHFLQYADTVDEDILCNVQSKAQRMSAVIDKEYAVYSLDMFSPEDELDAYERLFKGRKA